MLNIEVNKEIKGDNKIIAGLNLRQSIICAIAGVILIVLYFNTQNSMPLEYFMFVCMIVGAIAWWFGWHTKSGLKGEQHLMILIKNYMGGKEGRTYQTKNSYTTLSQKAIKIGKAKKEPKKQAKHSTLKSIM